MNARRFDLLVTWTLLVFAAWYGLVMLSYPDDAGRVPAIAAAIMVAALLVQLVVSYRRTTETREGTAGATGTPDAEPDPAASKPQAKDGAATHHRLGDVRHTVEEAELDVRHAVETLEPERDSYETLIALSGVRRRRFLAITLFSGLFYVGFILVGFVVTTGVLITAILFAARERPHVALLGGAIGAAAAYGLVVLLIGIPAMSGYLIP